MGMLDDIFGGDDDREREEMQENIDKIREKVQGGRERPPAPQSDDDLQPPVQPDRLQQDRSQEQSPVTEDVPEEQQPEPPGTSEEGLPEREPASPERDRIPVDQSGGEEDADGPTHDDVPEPPELKDLDVPDIEKGPLFITVDKFRDALEAIADMRRVAADMEDYIGSMEGTLQEDRETEDGVRQILDEAEADTEELKDIVSP
ncbi:MAG: hypothetical protein SVY41_02670 [Candidatus Nanohaloarchaea archaeon]|nr:hypothetical protein [Candidatus Nanohaloarchaea archaeon]